MNLFPPVIEDFHSHLDPAKVGACLRDPKGGLRFLRSHDDELYALEHHPVGFYRNSFTAEIYVTVKPEKEGSRVHAMIRLNEQSEGFALFFMLGCGFQFVVDILFLLLIGEMSVVLIGPPVLAVFTYVIAKNGFRYDADETVCDLACTLNENDSSERM